jgi:hypothetical protein
MLMGMEMPNWPALWEREPELRPMDVCSTLPGDNAWVLHGASASNFMPMAETTFAALCRDAAVRWLAQQWLVVTPPCIFSSSPTSDWGLYRVGVHLELAWSMPEMRNGRRVGPRIKTYDEALYAACKAVLNARQVATTQPPPLEK